MKIGVYVGSFDPFHKGHKIGIDYLLNNKYLDKIIVIPTMSYWDKNNLTDVKHRIKMLRFYETKNIIINDTLNDYQYTYQILNQLRKEYSNDNLYLIIGADNLEKFHLWKNTEEILNNKVIVLPRNNIDSLKYVNKFTKKENFIIIDSFLNIDISSTEIRKYLKEKNYKEVDKYLDKTIIDYIVKYKVY